MHEFGSKYSWIHDYENDISMNSWIWIENSWTLWTWNLKLAEKFTWTVCMNQGFWKICRFHGNHVCFLVVNTQKTEESLSNFQVMFGTLHYSPLPQGKFVNTSEGTSPINSMNVWSWLCQSRESMNMKRILHEFMNMNLKIPKSSWTWIWKYHEFMNMNEDFHEPRKKRHERYEF